MNIDELRARALADPATATRLLDNLVILFDQIEYTDAEIDELLIEYGYDPAEVAATGRRIAAEALAEAEARR